MVLEMTLILEAASDLIKRITIISPFLPVLLEELVFKPISIHHSSGCHLFVQEYIT